MGIGAGSGDDPLHLRVRGHRLPHEPHEAEQEQPFGVDALSPDYVAAAFDDLMKDLDLTTVGRVEVSADPESKQPRMLVQDADWTQLASGTVDS